MGTTIMTIRIQMPTTIMTRIFMSFHLKEGWVSTGGA
jgi:hypothetical protein